MDFGPGKKAFSPKRGLVFAVNGASAHPPPAPPAPRPRQGRGCFTENPRKGVRSSRGGGGGPGVCRGNFLGGGGGRGAEAIYRENEPPFLRKRLKRRTNGRQMGNGHF